MGHEGFRANEINFLQEQNNSILASIEEAEAARDQALDQIASCEEKDATLQSEVQGQRDKISALGGRLQDDKKETASKEEHVRVLSTQNKQMLTLLETEETKSKEYAESIRKLETRNRKLQQIAAEFDVAKVELEKQVRAAKDKCAETVATVKGARSLNETLRANIQNTEAKVRVDIEALGQALQVVDQKNLEYMTRISKQETREQQLKAETATLNEEVEQVRADIDALRKSLEGDEDGRTAFERARSQLEMTIEALEVQADTFKKALSTAERANEQLQEENRTSSDRCRETADKVYALMDSLRLNQVELKKQEAENGCKDKKLISLERQTQNLQAKISMETDAKVLAEQERKEAEQEAMVLKKKNKKIEESVTQSQQAQEKAERAIGDMNERVSELQTQNAYLASRIDGQEEDKSALKAEISKVSSRTSALTSENSELRDNIDRLEEEVAIATNDREQYTTELAYIKREDVLDDAGRQRPIMIQATESDLLEKLQVNEFLYEAQQARNPVPPIVEKIAQLLAMLHEGQERADQYLGDLSKSNGLVSALRQRNMGLYSRTQMFESFKTRALLRYVMNLVEGDRMSELNLDGISFGQREINEMINLLSRYDATDKVFVISLSDNGLDDDSINLLLQLVFSLPYLRRLDLRKNCITNAGIKRIQEQLKTMEGVTGVIPTANQVLNVHSGNQLRICVDTSEQIPKDHAAADVDFTVQSELSHVDADPFLATNAGASHHPWSKTAAAQSPKQVDPSGGEAAEYSDPRSNGGGPTVDDTFGGPPVGLGGPGNVAALNKKAQGAKKGQNRLPDPKKRQANRAKAAPPASLDYLPNQLSNQRMIDKCQSAENLHHSSRRSGSQRTIRSDSSDLEHDQRRSSSMERSGSMPALRKPARPVRNLAAARI